MLEHRIIEMMAEERIQQYREDAAHARLVREILPPVIPLHQRLAVSLATLLIAAGTSIQQRYEPVRSIQPETDCSTC